MQIKLKGFNHSNIKIWYLKYRRRFQRQVVPQRTTAINPFILSLSSSRGVSVIHVRLCDSVSYTRGKLIFSVHVGTPHNHIVRCEQATHERGEEDQSSIINGDLISSQITPSLPLPGPLSR